MAKRRYALQRGGPKELQLRWGWGLRNFEVSLGGKRWPIDRSALAAGTTLVLPDGSSLLVKRPRRFWHSTDSSSTLIVERDGIPLPGSDGDPRVLGRRAGRLILFFGGFRAFAITAVLLNARQTGEPVPLVVKAVAAEGVALLALGVVAMFGWRPPLAIAAGLLVAEGLAWLGSGGLPNPVGVMIQALVILHLFRAWKRMAPREKQPSLAQVFE
jgi:hypothetical protein